MLQKGSKSAKWSCGTIFSSKTPTEDARGRAEAQRALSRLPETLREDPRERPDAARNFGAGIEHELDSTL